MYSNCK